MASQRGLPQVIAPVRPTLKSRYPLTPIEVYAQWRRTDGQALDPWLRTHERIGGTIVALAPRSQTMTGSVADWEQWTELALPTPASTSSRMDCPHCILIGKPITASTTSRTSGHATADRTQATVAPPRRSTPESISLTSVRTLWPRPLGW